MYQCADGSQHLLTDDRLLLVTDVNMNLLLSGLTEEEAITAHICYKEEPVAHKWTDRWRYVNVTWSSSDHSKQSQKSSIVSKKIWYYVVFSNATFWYFDHE